MADNRIEAFDNYLNNKDTLFLINLKKIYIPNQNLFSTGKQQLNHEFIPIIQFLVFKKNTLTKQETNYLNSLSLDEIKKIKLKKYYLCKSKQDYYPETFGEQKCLNIIVDACVIGKNTKKVRECWKIFVAYNNLIKQTLLEKTDEIVQNLRLVVDSLSVKSVVLRGQLSLKGRIAGNDIDLLIFVDNKQTNSKLQEEIERLGKIAKLRRITWLEVDFNNNMDFSKQIYFDEQGQIDLDCYVTNGDRELERVSKGTLDEWLWNCGVLKNAKALINKNYFNDFVETYCSMQNTLKTKNQI
jgi:hypothetical protein